MSVIYKAIQLLLIFVLIALIYTYGKKSSSLKTIMKLFNEEKVVTKQIPEPSYNSEEMFNSDNYVTEGINDAISDALKSIA